MAKQAITEYTCDKCGATESVAINTSPVGWAHYDKADLSGTTLGGWDICPADVPAIDSALEKL